MIKKHTLSTSLLAIVVTVSILFSVSGNVWADPAGDQDPAVTSEQEEEEPEDPEKPAEPEDPAGPEDPVKPGTRSAPKGPSPTAGPTPAGPTPAEPTPPEPGAKYAIYPNTINITHCGYTDVRLTIDPFEFGPFENNYNEVEMATRFRFVIGKYTDKLTCGNETIDYSLATDKHVAFDDEGNIYDFTEDSLPYINLSVKVPDTIFTDGNPGTYTGTLRYAGVWYGDNGYLRNVDIRYITIKLVIPDSSSDYYEYGTLSNGVTWRLGRDGKLTINGNGPIPDFDKEKDVPWYCCKHLVTDIEIGSGITAIGNNAFYSVEYLKTVSIPNTVTRIGEKAFYYCMRNFERVAIPGSVKTIEDSAFSGCQKLSYVKLNEGLTSIGKSAFNMCREINSISIPSTVTDIGESAFYGCSNMPNVTIPSSITTIKDETFHNCSSMTKLVLPDGVTSIGKSAFEGCSALADVNIPGGVTSIGERAFAFSGITSAVIPSSFTSVPGWVFYCCHDLTSVTLPEGIVTIGGEAFASCTSLTQIKLPSTVRTLGYDAFYNTGLKTVELPDGLVTIGQQAFSSCKELTKINIPSTVTAIGPRAFMNCSSLISINLPTGITALKYDTFNSCTSLVSVTLPNGLKTIDSSVFSGCTSLKSIVIPSSVTKISYNAFRGCTAMNDVYCYADPENLEWLTDTLTPDFKTEGDKTVCHVPAGRLQLFETNFDHVNVVFTDENIDLGYGVHLYGYTLSLAGDIGINFWMDLDPEYDNADNYMLFTVNGKTRKVKVSEATSASNSDYKVFTCGVAAKEMTDTVTAQFYLADGTAVGEPISYTVRDYANYILTHDSYGQNTKAVVRAMLNYGACSQNYFNYHTDSLANSVLSADERCTTIASPDDVNYKTDGYGCIMPERVSLILNSTITLKLYFNNADAEGKVFIHNGKTLTPAKANGYTVVCIDDITAVWINSAVGLDVYENGTKLGYVVYSPAKYCKIVLGMETGGAVTDELKLVVTSLCEFNKALHNYIQNNRI